MEFEPLNSEFIKSYLENNELDFLNSLIKNKQYDLFEKSCLYTFKRELKKYINNLDKNFIIADEVENTFFANEKNELLIKSILENKPNFL